MLIFGYQTLAIGGLTYEISREDMAGDPMYWLYLNNAGAWVIQKRNKALGTYTYCQGKNDAFTMWGNRGILTYVEYSALSYTP